MRTIDFFSNEKKIKMSEYIGEMFVEIFIDRQNVQFVASILKRFEDDELENRTKLVTSPSLTLKFDIKPVLSVVTCGIQNATLNKTSFLMNPMITRNQIGFLI